MVVWWDSKLSLCDRHVQVFTTLDCNIPTVRGLRVVTDDGTPVLVANRLKNVMVLGYHVGHATIIYRFLPSAVLLRKRTTRLI